MELMDGQTLKYLVQRPADVRGADRARIGAQVADALGGGARGANHPPGHQAGKSLRDPARATPRCWTSGFAKVTEDRARRGIERGRCGGRRDRAGPGALDDAGDERWGRSPTCRRSRCWGEELDERTDLFSLGRRALRDGDGEAAVRGETPAGTVFDQILHKAPTAPVRLNPELPDELERILDKALEKDKTLRYQHASDLKTDLKRLRGTRRLPGHAAVVEAVEPPRLHPGGDSGSVARRGGLGRRGSRCGGSGFGKGDRHTGRAGGPSLTVAVEPAAASIAVLPFAEHEQ